MREPLPSTLHSEGLSNAMYIKAVAHSEDLTFIISRLYSPQYLNTFNNMTMVLNVTLSLVLITDLYS